MIERVTHTIRKEPKSVSCDFWQRARVGLVVFVMLLIVGYCTGG